jgi:hypothetical protein
MLYVSKLTEGHQLRVSVFVVCLDKICPQEVRGGGGALPVLMQTQTLPQRSIRIAACLLKARIVKPAETAVARERLCKHARR